MLNETTKISWSAFPSFSTRSEAALRKATTLPSALIIGSSEVAFPPPTSKPTLTSSVVPVDKSRTKIFLPPTPVLSARRSCPELAKATTVPSALITGLIDERFTSNPSKSTLTRSVVPAFRSRIKISSLTPVASGTKLVEVL